MAKAPPTIRINPATSALEAKPFKGAIKSSPMLLGELSTYLNESATTTVLP